jgi:hypothetical protein
MESHPNLPDDAPIQVGRVRRLGGARQANQRDRKEQNPSVKKH